MPARYRSTSRHPGRGVLAAAREQEPHGQQVRDSEGRHGLLANRFPLLLWWGPHYISIYNDAYIPVLGTKHPQALGQPVSECWNEIWDMLQPLIDRPFHGGPATDDRARVGSAIAAALEIDSTGVYDIEYRIVWPDATEHWIVANGRAHFTGVGAARRPTAFVGTALDITAVRASQHMLQRLTETVPSVIYVYDLKTDRNVYANQLLSELLGYTPEEAQALGNQFLPTVVHPEDWAATPTHIARLLRLEDGTVLEREYRMQPKGGPLRFWG
jgi:PAS domain S-box-containing protein